MSPEAQRIAIAEACGWRHVFINKWLKEYGKEGQDEWVPLGGKSPEGDDDHLPSYLDDLNAMHAAEKKLTWEQGGLYNETLYFSLPSDQHLYHATAAQRAEAFLRTLGLFR